MFTALTHLQRRKCIIATILIVEIVLFSIITFVIAYVSSLNAIHHASQQLADSMVDTVSVRITAYLTQTEQPIQRLATLHSDSMLPIDDHSDVPWFTRWVLVVQALMMASNFDVFAYAVLFDDACFTALALLNPQRLLLLDVVDGRTAAADGYRRATSTILDIATMQDILTLGLPNATLYYPTWGTEGIDHRTKQPPGYYYVKELFRWSGQRCFWSPLLLYYEAQRFETSVTCSIINTTGTYIGQFVVVRDISELTNFLQQTAATPNTAIFVMDGSLFLTAATTATPTSTITFTDARNTVSVGLAPGCISSLTFDNSSTGHSVGCRSSALDYPYPPLQDLAKTDASFLTSPTRTSDYRPLAGSGYYFLVSLPIMQSLQLVLFLPESDVLGDVQQGVVLSIVVCALLCVIGAVLSSALVATLIGNPARLSSMRRSSSQFTLNSLSSLQEHYNVYNELMANIRAGFSPLTHQPSPTSFEAAFVVAMQGSHVDETVSIIANRHGGDVFSSPVAGTVIVFRTSVLEEAATRAVLCGLALINARVAPTASVTMGEVPCARADGLGSEALHSALALLSIAEEGQVLVAGDVYYHHCVTDVFVSTRLADTHGAVEVEAVTDRAWQLVPRRVHFDRKGASLAALLKG